ncbi:MAG TPA: hypothetical protein ENL20_01065 [Candidatus Cloacimonetes bacterium]|nr:hypothetical protein [Candidatus Cloacimonadota bacterium]
MGTQQILLIVLSVIIVGIAVAVGISMFNSQAVNANRQAIVADINNFGAQAMAYFRSPASHGGGAGTFVVDEVGQWLGYNYNATADSLYTENGEFGLTTDGAVLTIVGVGTETGNDGTNPVKATATVTGATGAISTTIDN